MLWHVVAGQCFLEVTHATKAVPDKAFREMQSIARAVRDSASKSIGVNQGTSLQYEGLDATVRGSMIRSIEKLILNDPTYHYATQQLSPGDPGIPPQFGWFKHSPLFCGQHAHSILEDAHRWSIIYANRFAAVFGVVHLVNAAH